MAYKIDYLDAKGLISTDTCGSLTKAKEIAEKALANKMADTVEIRDAAGVILYRRPRTLTRA